MNDFNGFPARMDFTPLPAPFLSAVLPEINDANEIKVILYAISALYRKKTYPKYITAGELAQNEALIGALPEPAAEEIESYMDSACDRKVFIKLTVETGGDDTDIYMLNTPADREASVKIAGGEIKISGIKSAGIPAVKPVRAPDLFKLYEQNIGVITPMIADELKAAEKLYPQGWLEDAFKEAVTQNKRKWSYISAILERWAAEGRTDGTHQRDSKASPDKYVNQKYGNMVQR